MSDDKITIGIARSRNDEVKELIRSQRGGSMSTLPTNYRKPNHQMSLQLNKNKQWDKLQNSQRNQNQTSLDNTNYY